MTLNEQAARFADAMQHNASSLRIATHTVGGARVLDCGIAATGGLNAGGALAALCLAVRGAVSLVQGPFGLSVQVTSDDPVLACMASQYAGWAVSVGKYFAMGSGPMRAAYGKEELFNDVPGREVPPVAVGVLETRKMPTEEVIAYLTERVKVPAEKLTLACAPASSLAGTVQVVARSLETALHKLHELKFDLRQVVSGAGVAPLPPVGKDDIQAIGWTNDAILYGGVVDIWVRAEDEALAEVGPKVPSGASAAHGAPFAEVFEQAGRDFYKIDPHLFSPAVVRLMNLNTGRLHVFGRVEAEVLRRSFGA